MAVKVTTQTTKTYEARGFEGGNLTVGDILALADALRKNEVGFFDKASSLSNSQVLRFDVIEKVE